LKNEAKLLAERINNALPHVRSGTLRFWGEWFGRPHDNCHVLLRCDAEQDHLLQLYFNQGETLSVWAPRDLTADDSAFRILSADRVRWEWFYYGRPQVPANLYFMDFLRSAKQVTATTKIDWSSSNLKPNGRRPAVEIL
jgi:hypothetical protein